MKYFLAIFAVFILTNAAGQDIEPGYKELKRIGDSLYKAGDYKSAAFYLSSAVRAADAKPTFWDWDRAAFSWSLAGNADSAFYYLEKIAAVSTITFSDYLGVIDDPDFDTLKTDARWTVTNDRIFNNAFNNFYGLLPTLNEKDQLVQRRQAADAWAFNKKVDSAFFQLDKIAASRQFSFDLANQVLNRGYYRVLYNDKRWDGLKNKMFSLLYKKYFPDNFAKTAKNKNIIIDEGHYNYHTITGTYAVLAGTLASAGFKVSAHKGVFTISSLKDADFLIISNPQPDRTDSLVRRAARAKEPVKYATTSRIEAYADAEAATIKNWVEEGGSLLLILDHAPYPIAGKPVAEALGVEIRNVSTYDNLYRDPEIDTITGGKTIVFTKSKKLLGKHFIMHGVDSVTTATGSSLIGPAGSDVLLYLPATALDEDWQIETKQYRYRSAAGRTQGVAFQLGRGRVVVLGEAAMLSPNKTSVPNRGNWKMLFNILRWLARSKR